MFIAHLIQDGRLVLGTEYSRVMRLKTWQGVCARLLKMRMPDHARDHWFEVLRLDPSTRHVLDCRKVRVSLGDAHIGPRTTPIV